MIYRNGIKEYLFSALIFGGIMGIFVGLATLSIFVGIVLGIFSGCLFSFLIFLFVKFMEKKYDKMRIEIAKERKIICDGGATVKGNGGWMFLTENGLEFYPHKINFSQEELFIPLDAITGVGTKGNMLLIDTSEALKFSIVVSKNKQWKEQIEYVIKDM